MDEDNNRELIKREIEDSGGRRIDEGERGRDGRKEEEKKEEKGEEAGGSEREEMKRRR
jgi:hypothetical protein